MSSGNLSADPTPIHSLGRCAVNFVVAVGDLSAFAMHTVGAPTFSRPKKTLRGNETNQYHCSE